MELTITIPDDVQANIGKLITRGKYKDEKDFINQAVATLLMAEKQASMFSLPAAES